MKRIKRIEIKGLLGQYNYELDLRLNERITMIFAPNGRGKTKLLTLINASFNNDFHSMYEVPFHNIKFRFTDESYLKITKVIQETEEEQGYLSYEFGKFIQEFEKGKDIKDKEFRVNINKAIGSLMRIERRFPFLKRIGAREWYDTISNRKLQFTDIINEYEDLIFEINFEIEEEDREIIQNLIKVHLIETDRLYDIGNKFINRHNANNSGRYYDETDTSTVNVYSSEIKQLISKKLNEFASVSQELDRTFPSRVVNKIKRSTVAKIVYSDNIIENLNELSEHRRQLSKIGLLDNQNETFEDLPENIDHYTASVLELYIEDTKKKLAVFDDLEKRISLFLDIINSRFGDKDLIIDKDEGFVIRLHSGRDLKNVKQLSSGEQHALVMYYDLLFHSTPNTLVLVDEPEISLHIEWQQNYLTDLKRITELTKVDFIIATHSPDIMNGNWDLSIPLQNSGGLLDETIC